MDFKKLYRELVRRNVFRAVVAYMAVAWVVIQIASIILPAFGAPSYLLKGLIYVLAAGLVFWTGFSWAYDLTPEGIQKTSEDSVVPEARQQNTRRLNSVILGSGITALLILAAGSFWAGSQWQRRSIGRETTHYRIAVLPFENRSNTLEYDYLREGLAEEIMAKLVNSQALSVISSRSSFQFRDTNGTVDQISKKLDADLVLTGSFDLAGPQLKVMVELIRGKDQEVLNFATLVGELSQIQEISADVRNRIYQALALAENPVQGTGLAPPAQVHVEAYKYNALGNSAMRDNTGQDLDEITRYFQAAIDLDPDYAAPYIGMAEAYIFEVNRGYISTAEGAGMARKFALEAEKINPGCGEVSGLMGVIHFMDFDFKNAVHYFERSLEKTPNYSLTYHWYAFTLELLGDFKKAEDLQKKAAVLDPLNAMNDAYLIMNYIFQDKFNNAETLINNRLSMDPNHKQTLWLKAFLQAETGQFEAAYQTFLDRGIGLETNFVAGYIYGRLGLESHAQMVLDNMMKVPFVSPSQLAIVYCGLGRNDLALEQAEEAFLTHDSWIGWLVFTSMTDPIKNDPRYRSIMERMAL